MWFFGTRRSKLIFHTKNGLLVRQPEFPFQIPSISVSFSGVSGDEAPDGRQVMPGDVPDAISEVVCESVLRS